MGLDEACALSSSRGSTALIEPELALQVASRGSCAVICLSLLEQVHVFDRMYGRQGLYAGPVTRLVGAPDIPLLYRTSRARILLVVGAIAALSGVLFSAFTSVGKVALVVTFFIAVINRLKRVMGGDGAEQMAMLSIFATCVATLPGNDPFATRIAVWFIGAQLILSYVTAGAVKAVSPVWRSGMAISLVMGSEAYGHARVAEFLGTAPRVSRFLSRAVIAGECLFPLILVMPIQGAIAMMLAGFVFHLTTAFSMGLNTFAIAFPTTFLCVAVLARDVSPFW